MKEKHIKIPDLLSGFGDGSFVVVLQPLTLQYLI